ncbi:uncharacterized protein LOC132270381 [Cornus florida]|uniref:uncharacterized protein LOC132270381 n=1 Tax=Cornus florida TaxID=4283 RepID=UPI00289C1F39|nr:uncharacterized protein LOC132270381 [Cornus florida]
MNIPQASSSNWNKLMELRGVARSIIKIKVGCGSQTFFWDDNWLQGGPLTFRATPDFIRDSHIPAKQKLSTFSSNNHWEFPIVVTQQFPDLLLLDPPCNSPDKVEWIPSPTGVFSLTNTVTWLAPHHQPRPWNHLVWNSFSIPRCKFILWLAVQKRLPTKDRRCMQSFPDLNSASSTNQLMNRITTCSFRA